jgi:hypothetical protein
VGLDDLRAAGMADGTWPAEPIPPRNPNLEGRARMAEVRRAAGIPLTADDLEALKSSIRPRAVAS